MSSGDVDKYVKTKVLPEFQPIVRMLRKLVAEGALRYYVKEALGLDAR